MDFQRKVCGRLSPRLFLINRIIISFFLTALRATRRACYLQIGDFLPCIHSQCASFRILSKISCDSVVQFYFWEWAHAKKKRRRKYMKFQIVNERNILEISGFLD